MELIKLENIKGEYRVHSMLIAEKLGNDHRNVIAMIKKFETTLSDYGRVLF